jgi:hypothetical protein
MVYVMTIWGGHIPPETGRSIPLNHTYSCFLYDHSEWSRSPFNRKCPNISKIIEIPTPKPCIFLFVVSRNILL